MSSAKRVTVYFEPELHRALRLKAASTDQTISLLVNDAIRASLAEDADDLAMMDARASEPTVSLESVLADLKRRGKL